MFPLFINIDIHTPFRVQSNLTLPHILSMIIPYEIIRAIVCLRWIWTMTPFLRGIIIKWIECPTYKIMNLLCKIPRITTYSDVCIPSNLINMRLKRTPPIVIPSFRGGPNIPKGSNKIAGESFDSPNFFTDI